MVQSLSYLAANTKLGTGDDSVSLVASGNSFVISDGSQSSTIAAGTDLGSGGATVYANSQAFPLTGLSAGDFAFASNNNTLYMTNGSGWYKIALVNQDPSISLSATSVTTEPGSNTANVTYTITEPEGTPTTITISYDFTANANIVHDSSNTSLSITNTDSNTYTGTVTVTVSDGVNTGVGTISLTNTVIIIIDNSNYTSLLVKASGDGGTNTSITDSSTNSHSVTVNGNTQATSFSPYRYSGYSAYIDGSGSDWLKTDTHADFAFGTGDFTVECWYYPVSKAQDFPRILHFGTYWLNNQSWGILDRHDSYSTKISVQAYSGAVLESTTTVTDGEWYHIALERSGTTITLYINGTAEDTYNISTNNFPDASSTSYLNIGNVSDGTNLSEAEANGYVKDVRIVKGSAVYQGNFTPPTETLTAITNTVFLGLTKPYFTDASGQGHTLTANGPITNEPFSPYDYNSYIASTHGGSVYFDGNGDYLTIASGTSELDLGTGDFTIETWVYPEEISTNYPTFLGSVSGWNTGASGHRFDNTGYAGKFWFGLNGSSGVSNGDPFMASANSYPHNVWYHYVLTRSGNTWRMFVNGNLQEVQTYSGSYNANYGGTRMGYSTWDGANGWWKGFVGDLRIVKGSVVTEYQTSSTTEGDQIFTPPTSPLTDITNTSVLISGSDAKVYDASQTAGTLTLNGDAASSTTQTKYATSSIYFDGTGDNINFIEGVPSFSGDFTVEFWVNFSTVQNCDFFGAATNNFMYIDYYGGYLRIGDYGGGYNVRGSWTPSTSTWYHIVAARNNGTTTLYVDGTELASATDTYSYATGSYNIGYHVNGYFHGYIEDFRITKGLARYTSSFTPPTAELEG